MKSFRLLFFALALIGANHAKADDFTFGNGIPYNNNGSDAIAFCYYAFRTELLYDTSLLGPMKAGDKITKISFKGYCTTAYSRKLTIYIENTNDHNTRDISEFKDTEGMTKIADSKSYSIAVGGVKDNCVDILTIDIDDGFEYQGKGLRLVIIPEYKTGSSSVWFAKCGTSYTAMNQFASQTNASNLASQTINKSKHAPITTFTYTSNNISFTAGQKSTICLPEGVDFPDGSYYELASATSSSVTFNKVVTPVANTPYVFEPTADCSVSTAKLSGKNLTELTGANAPSAAVGDIIFQGTFTRENIKSDESYQLYGFSATTGDFVKIGSTNGAYINPLHAYLKVPVTTGARELNFIFEDSETTGISEASHQDKKADEAIFDLQGRRVSQPTKGLYIVDGKKVVVKKGGIQ